MKDLTGIVLAVDDEKDILESFRLVMNAMTPQVELRMADSAEDALAMLSDDIDVIISDYRMPGMDGLEFLAKARERLPDAKSVLVTAYPDPTLKQRAFDEAGVAVFLKKPFETSDLLEILESTLG